MPTRSPAGRTAAWRCGTARSRNGRPTALGRRRRQPQPRWTGARFSQNASPEVWTLPAAEVGRKSTARAYFSAPRYSVWVVPLGAAVEKAPPCPVDHAAWSDEGHRGDWFGSFG